MATQETKETNQTEPNNNIQESQTAKIGETTDDKLNESTESIVQPNEINPNSQLRMDILKAFGADLNTNTRENILFANKALIYPCGKHLTLRDLSVRGDNDTHKNEQLFIFMENDTK